MTDNNNHDWQEQLERLLKEGQPSSDNLLNDLAGTQPQARPEFQRQLEERLVLMLNNQPDPRREETMQGTALHNTQARPEHQRRSLPVTLAAALAIMLFGGLAVIMTRTPHGETGPLLSAADQDATSTALAQPGEIPTATPFPLTIEPVDPLAQTSTAIIAEASQQAATVFAATQVPPQVTLIRPNPDNGLPCQIVDPAGTAVLYAQPDAESHLMGTLPAASRLEVATVATDNAGETWLYVEFVQNGPQVSGWVRESDVRVLAICFYDDDEYALLNGQVVATGTVIPSIDPIQQTATAIIAQATYSAAATQFAQSQAQFEAAQQQLGILPSPTFVPTVPPPVSDQTMALTFTPTMTATATHTAFPTVTPIVTPTLEGYYGSGATQVTLTIADTTDVDVSITVGNLVNVLMLVPPTHDPEIWVPLIQYAYVLEIQQVEGAAGTRVRLNLPPGSDTQLLYQVMDAQIRLKLALAE